MKITLLLLLLIVVAFMVYVRAAPSDAGRWHRPLAASEPGDTWVLSGFTAVRAVSGDDVLARLDAVVQATPRTKVSAGSVDSGLITYITRSRLLGFPDYTTVQLQDGMLAVRGRLRFGKGDSGVNRARIEGWLAQAGVNKP